MNTDCIRVDWYLRGACYAFVHRATSDYCINNARPNGPNYVTCTDQGMFLVLTLFSLEGLTNISVIDYLLYRFKKIYLFFCAQQKLVPRYVRMLGEIVDTLHMHVTVHVTSGTERFARKHATVVKNDVRRFPIKKI